MTALIFIGIFYCTIATICAVFSGLFWYSPQLRHRWLIADEDRKEP